MSKALVEGFQNVSDQEIDIIRDPYDILLRIVEAIDSKTGLKDDEGRIKNDYPACAERPLRSSGNLIYHAAVLADVACYKMTAYGGNVGFSRFVMNSDAIIKAVRSLPHDDNGNSFEDLVYEAWSIRDKADGRQTDFEDMYNWNKRMDLVRRYNQEHRVFEYLMPHSSVTDQEMLTAG